MTEVTEMIERVARAICDADFGHGAFDKISDGIRSVYAVKAHAAIAAMRKPTEAVLLVAAHYLESSVDPRFAWQAMINAALEESNHTNTLSISSHHQTGDPDDRPVCRSPGK